MKTSIVIYLYLGFTNAELNPVFEESWRRAKPHKPTYYEGQPDFSDRRFPKGNPGFVNPEWTPGPPKLGTVRYGTSGSRAGPSERPFHDAKTRVQAWTPDNKQPQNQGWTENIPHPQVTEKIPRTTSTPATGWSSSTPVPQNTTTPLVPCFGPGPGASVVGGEQAKPMEFCQIVYIMYSNREEKKKYECGGSIVNQEYVLTAAHCLHGRDPASYTVLAGKYNVNTTEPNETRHTGSRVVRHPMFNSLGCANNDIGLIKVHPPFKFDQCVQPVVLNHPSYRLVPPQDPVAIGWGLTGYTTDGRGIHPGVLFKVTLPLVDENGCREAYSDSKNTCIGPGVLCAGGDGRDICTGVSGGPLLVGTIQIGVVSKGVRYCSTRNKAPSINTDVAYHRDWIDKTIGETNFTSNYFFERIYSNPFGDVSVTNFTVAVNSR